MKPSILMPQKKSYIPGQKEVWLAGTCFALSFATPICANVKNLYK
jgi:hypothetical protein